MKKTTLLLALLSVVYVGKGQNLVPNGDFEGNIGCPFGENQLFFANPWYNPAQLTPDYFNSCSIDFFSDVPVNFHGFQNAHSGVAYAGIFTTQMPDTNIREYIRVQLSQPMQAGINYFVQFYINLSDMSQNCITSMGAYISVSDTAPMNGYLMTVVPQIMNSFTSPLCDTAIWIPINGVYTSSGNENYITIGNFVDDNSCGLQTSGTGAGNWSYYFIDDVSVTIYTGIAENTQPAFNIYPNPAQDEITITIPPLWGGKEGLIIFDVIGKEVQTISNNKQNQTINISHLQSGIYFIEINNVRKKLVVSD